MDQETIQILTHYLETGNNIEKVSLICKNNKDNKESSHFPSRTLVLGKYNRVNETL